MNGGPARFAVLSDDEIRDANGSRPHNTARLRTFAEICRLGNLTANKQVWILPGSALYKRIKADPGSFFADAAGYELRPVSALATVVSGWRPSLTKSKVQIIMPGIAKSQWALDDITDALTLFIAVDRLGQLLGTSPTYPTGTAQQIVDSTAGTYWPLPDVPDYAAYWRPFLEHGEADLIFKRALLPHEKGAKWLHVIDKKRQYLTACSVPLGVGEYRHAQAVGAIVPPKHKMKPGLYKVRLGGDALTHPYSFLRDFDVKEPHWHYAPTVQAALDMGYRVEVLEAYSWGRARRLLEPFYERVNGAMRRTEARMMAEGLHPEDATIRACLKAVYTRFFGWLTAEREDGRKDRLYRPDVWWQIVSSAKARLIRNLNDGVEGGALAAGCRIDALFFFSHERDWREALPPPFTGAGSQYKLSYTVPADAAGWEQRGTIVEVDEHCKLVAKTEGIVWA